VGTVGSTRETADVTKIDSLRLFAAKFPITHIVNCAAVSQVDLAEVQRRPAFLVNTVGPGNLACVAQEIGAKLIHISTDYVFPGTGSIPLQEEDPVGPVNYYGRTKLEGEKRVGDACIIRTSAIFGEGGRNFIASLLQMRHGEVFLSNDQIHSPTYVEDLVDAIVQLQDATGIYHFSNRGGSTKYMLGARIAHLLDLPITLHPVPSSFFSTPCKRPAYTVFDLTKVSSIVPTRPWEEALEEFICASFSTSS
jgi:dTDP-4-dehydrorhamnose reductase